MGPEQDDSATSTVVRDELADITREARTALTDIVGYSEMLSEDLQASNPEALADLERIRDSSRKVLSLVARLEQQVDNARAEAALDALTGIANRRTFESRCEALFAAGAEHPLSLVLIDLDKFKNVNDTLGHLAGDDVLKGVVDRCRGAVRDSDLLARLAGDEFVLLLPSTPHDEAMRIADRVRRHVTASPLDTCKGPVDVTVSLGVASRTPSDQSVAQLIDRADKSMYAAKGAGRDQVGSLET